MSEKLVQLNEEVSKGQPQELVRGRGTPKRIAGGRGRETGPGDPV